MKKINYTDPAITGILRIEENDSAPEQLYNVVKTYDQRPSKNIIDEKEVTLEEARSYLDMTQSLWRKNGGLVVEYSQDILVCEEADGSETITFSIQEVNY